MQNNYNIQKKEHSKGIKRPQNLKNSKKTKKNAL